MSHPQSTAVPRVSSGDYKVVDRLRRSGQATIAELSDALGVTATAVRQRLARLTDAGLVERTSTPAGRGRPTHQYGLTQAGQRTGGNNYSELVDVLWKEIRGIKDKAVQQGLLSRLAVSMAEKYRTRISGENLTERMSSLAAELGGRDIAFEVNDEGGLPVLTALACPYPDLAEQDRGICALEKMLFTEVLGEDVRLSECRLDGETCCKFEPVAT
ncbi:helix-turn-helix transcriptional regulator [Adhaeretor mobilis]|uniref:MarR family protein n=1 Tax=Adhaeretor mobilis TaxID=1930276 RepID=A0A517MX09_9BACT|nr:MarR family transcriptional regulator [Adhaeretor mobilis]QDS99412.1 MarR family protein [Adhaeretor mobilis]